LKQPISKRVVEVVPYDTAWPAMFREEKKMMRRILKDEVLEIHHIGSTAIPGMYSKPTIDILVVVRKIEKVDDFNAPMSGIGYVAKGEFGIPGRRFFYKGSDRRSHHLHIFQEGSPEIDRHLRFRDFMISHPREAAEYAQLKRGLASRFRSDIDSYCHGKDAFIKEIDAKAEAWVKASRA
jgi:GrpB-like predicted nucleotidyltransferase (UPF0157 family)